MLMGKKGAILMLAIVVLWAAGPALAFITPAPCHSCCRAMMMDCDPATMSAAHPCCQLDSSGTAIPRGPRGNARASGWGRAVARFSTST